MKPPPLERFRDRAQPSLHRKGYIVGINQGVPSNAGAPFGGIKQSGLGREGSAEGLEEYENIRFYNVARRATA